MKPSFAISVIVITLALLSVLVCPLSAQTWSAYTPDGRPIVIPKSSIPHPGRIHTNYFLVDPASWNPDQPDSNDETPASLACVYKLVKQIEGCPIATAKNIPAGGVGAIAIVDAGDYPTAAQDLKTFSQYFGIPFKDSDFKVVYAGEKPPVYGDWEVEESLDIEWAHAMAPKAKLFLVESVLCTLSQCNTDPTWQAVKVASELVAKHGGGVISMSWGIPEWAGERKYDHYFTTPGVVYFGGAGDWGIPYSFHPAASPNVVAVGGTYFERDGNGNFLDEVYYGGSGYGGGGDISPYEPRPSYQNIIEGIVGNYRGYPDVASDYCCAPIYLTAAGGWGTVGGTSWASPTFAGIVNAAGRLEKSSHDELTMIYKEYGNPKQYAAEFYDITQGSSYCMTGWDECAGVGSPRTYTGK
jgi:subtilase family serine protease